MTTITHTLAGRPTLNVGFEYDAAGNRTRMTDGTGEISYHYNTLGQLSSETRQFAGPLSGLSYGLTYEYYLGGQLKKITDHTNTTIKYSYDRAGAVTSVAGEDNLAGGVSTYASGFVYRAWGALKDISFGNGTTQHANFNSRLLPTSSSLGNVVLGDNENATMSWSYDYYADTRQRHVYDATNDHLDRLLEFDHAGRLKEAYSGREARGLAPTSPADSPYRQSFQYNAYGDLTQKSGRFWRSPQGGAMPCVPRQANDTCDNEGNLMDFQNDSHTYDAVGNQTTFVSWRRVVGGSPNHPEELPGIEIAQTYDGDGQPAKRVETRRSQELINGGPNTNITETVTTTYYIYSSVLGGSKVVELDATGNKVNGYVYANGSRLAKQEIVGSWSGVLWYHSNAGTNSWIETTAGRSPTRQEMDPEGAEVTTEDPYLQPAPTYENLKQEEPLYIDGGDPFDYVSGYTLDGLPMTRSQLNRIVGKMGVGQLFLYDKYRVDSELWNYPSLWTHPQYYEGTYSRDLSRPQKRNGSWRNFRLPWPQMLIDESRIKDAVLAAIGSKDCQEFAKTVLDALAKRRNGLGTLMTVASQFFGLGGDRFTRVPPPGSTIKIANPLGRIANRTAQIFSRGDFSNSVQEQMVNDSENAIAELFHLAAQGDYYSDEELAKAVNQSSYAADAYLPMGTTTQPLIDPRSNPFDSRYIPDKEDPDDLDNSYSRYFHTIQSRHCTTQPGTTRGVGFSPR